MDKVNKLISSTNRTDELVDELQKACLKVRKQLFYDPRRKFNHNMGGVRTGESLQEVTKSINALTNGFITFHFVSHRRLWFEIEGVNKRYSIHAANEYDYYTKESADTNPYLKIAKEVKKALREKAEMEKTYQLLIAA